MEIQRSLRQVLGVYQETKRHSRHSSCAPWQLSSSLGQPGQAPGEHPTGGQQHEVICRAEEGQVLWEGNFTTLRVSLYLHH